MSEKPASVGLALNAAMTRAEELRASTERKVRVRLMPQWGDDRENLTIVARIAARTGPELEVQGDKGVRKVLWGDLDARAGELVGLVEAAAAEIEEAVRTAPPPPPRPSLGEGDFDSEAFLRLVETSYETLARDAGPLMATAPTLSPAATAEAVVLGAMKVVALAALGGRIEGADLEQMLKDAMADVRDLAGLGDLPLKAVH
ncbi:hypothetical protein ACETK8_20260 (plasmid) [Brevundimonas staleyi]|uniref:Uncharacterized protein n=1 Tax=Brevundimonas staleyi TaxID=74326 RepID=A0ABW0FQA6_9CAUL